MKLHDHRKRRNFREWVKLNPAVKSRILFSDEAHFWLSGYGDMLRSQVYADSPQTLNDFKLKIRRVIAGIHLQLLEKVFENWTSRMRFLLAGRGPISRK